MRLADVPLRIAHLASFHVGEPLHDPDLLATVVDQVRGAAPDVVVVAGDLTAGGYAWEYEKALAALRRLDAPLVVVPGNHDSRNVGYIHFERELGDRFSHHRITLDRQRAERLRMTGVTVVGLDSSVPDLDDGHIGREWYGWIRKQLDVVGDLKVVVLHHHLVAVPGAGRDLSVITDAGDLLPILSDCEVDMILSGHRHVPAFWGLNGMLVANCGTAATRRLRGRIPPSWNELVVDASTIRIYLHYPDGRRELSVLRSRTTQQTVREAFHVTDRFLASNHLPVG